MKKATMACVLLLFVVSSVFAATFSPTVMKLKAPAAIQYDFSGSTLKVPFTASGKQGTVYLFVFTKDKASTIAKVTNGFLGWHYVNKIDTCLFVSPASNFDIGTNEIQWNGKDENGNAVPAGVYTYYLWAFDSINLKIPASRVIAYSGVKGVHIEAYDEAGTPKTNPVLYPLDRIQAKKRHRTAC